MIVFPVATAFTSFLNVTGSSVAVGGGVGAGGVGTWNVWPIVSFWYVNVCGGSDVPALMRPAVCVRSVPNCCTDASSERAVTGLVAYVNLYPRIGLEPSCAMTLRRRYCVVPSA